MYEVEKFFANRVGYGIVFSFTNNVGISIFSKMILEECNIKDNHMNLIFDRTEITIPLDKYELLYDDFDDTYYISNEQEEYTFSIC